MLATKKQANTDRRYCTAPVVIGKIDSEAPMSKEEYFAKLDRSIQQYEEGHCTELTPQLQKQLLGL
jgi:hypothetical protein